MRYLMKTKRKNTCTAGFTIIETMIATSIFVVVMLVGVQVLLSANQSHKTTENLRAVMDNMSFVMEDMARNIRLGSNFQCPAGIGASTSCPLPGTLIALDGTQARLSLEFTSVNGNQIAYALVSKNPLDLTQGEIQKSATGASSDYQSITPPEVVIDLGKSGFTVTGAEVGDQKQPYIIIRLVGSVTYQNIETPFDLQTSISPRAIDS